MKNKIAERLETVTHTHTHGGFKEKYIIKLTVFVLLFATIFYCITKILWIDPYPIKYFYDEPENSLDVIYIGASNVCQHFNSVLAYDLYGYTTGLMSADSQPFPVIKYCLKETQKTQNPSLYVVDIAKVASNVANYTEEEIRKTTDSIKFSKNRIDAINECLSYKKDIDKKDYINHYFSFLLYHNRWKDLRKLKPNIFGDKTYYKGYIFRDYCAKIEIQNTYNWSQDVIQLEEENKKILMSLIDYINTNNLNVLFVIPRRYYEEEVNGKLNDAIRIIQENKLKVINFNTLDDSNNIDFNTDFYNSTHLNVYGATKYTLYFAKYLHENYELENHKGDKNYNSWENEYERFKKNFKQITNKDFDELLETIKSL